MGQQWDGEIIDSHSADSVSGLNNGGLVGLQYGGAIADSYATGRISGGAMPGNGGLVGDMAGGGPGGGTISNSYATGSVSGNTYADGGLVGYTNGGSGGITNSYATGLASGSPVSSGNFNGGLVGWDYSGTNNGDYYLLPATPYYYNWGGITGLTATQMSQQSSFIGWDFASKTASWAIDSSGKINNGYPYWAAIITSSLPIATAGSNYQFTMMAFDRAGVKSWSATGLPTGITMDSSTGVLSGAPLKSGNYSVTVTMQDTAGNTRTTSLSLEVATEYPPTLGTTPTAAPGSSVGTTTVTATPNTSGDTLVYRVSTSTIAAPLLNSAQPSGSNVFTSGTNLSAAAGDTVGVYELNSSKQVVAFSSLTLTKSDILGATITYDGNGATGIAPTDSNQYLVGASPTVAGQGSLTKTGYTFVGWNTKADGSGTSYAPGASLTMPASNVTLYAQWTINNYPLSYNGNGNTSGSVPSGSSPSYNTTITVPGNTGNLTKTGYTFTGWNTKADGTGTDYAPGASLIMPASKVTLYAQWFLNPTGLQHTKVTSTGWSESWIPVSGVSSYDIYLDGSKVGTVTQATYDFTGKQPGTTYDVTIASVNGSGQVSAQSKSDLVTTLYNATGVPTDLQHSDVTTTGWKETWTPVTGASVGTVTYDVYLNGKQVGTTSSTAYSFTGLLSGTTYSVTIASVNGSGQASGQSLPDQVKTVVPLSVGTTWAWNGQYGVPFHALQLEAVSGDAPYTWSVIQGALPLGLKLSSGGVISGTPTGPSVGSTFTVQVTDVSGQKASKALSIQVWGAKPLTIQTTSLPKGNMGKSYSAQLLAGGGKPFQWSLVSGTLPTGVSLSQDGLLSGVPTESGNFELTVQVSDGAGNPVHETLKLDAQPLPAGQALFNFNGHIQTIPVVMNHGIPYLPIWYLMQRLNTVGMQSHWLGQEWYLNTATQPYLYFLEPGSGTASIYLNGVLVQKVTPESAVDSATHELNTFMPLWSLTRLLNRIGYHSTWDGTTWTVTK